MIGQMAPPQNQPSPDDLPKLMEAYAKHGDLATLFQIHEMNQMRQASQRNSAMGSNVPQETIMDREVEAYQNGGIRDLAQRVGGAAQHQSEQAQQNMNAVAQSGIQSQPTPDVAQAAYSGGGIVAFAGPEGSVVPEADDSSVRQKFWSWVASLGVDAASLAGPQLDKLREKYLEMGGELGDNLQGAVRDMAESVPTMAEIGEGMPRSDLGSQQRLDVSPVTSAISDGANSTMDATEEFLAGIGDTNSVANKQGSVLLDVAKGVPGLMADGLLGMLPTPEPNAELADMGGAPGSNGAQPPREAPVEQRDVMGELLAAEARIKMENERGTELADMGGAPGSNGAQPPQPPREAMKFPSMPETGIGAVLSKLFSPSSAQSAANRTRDSRVENAAAKGQAHTEFDFKAPYDPNAAPAQEVKQAVAAAEQAAPQGIAATEAARPTTSPQMNPESLGDITQQFQKPPETPAYDPMKGVEAIANPDLRAAIENKASPTVGPQIDPRSPDTRGIASVAPQTSQERYDEALGKAEDPKKLAMDRLIASLAGAGGRTGEESGIGASGARLAMAGKAEGDAQESRQIARRKEEMEYDRGVEREDSVMAQEQANSIALLGEKEATMLEQVQATEAIRLQVQKEANKGRLAEANVDAANRVSIAELQSQTGIDKLAAQYGFESQLNIAGARNDRYEAIMGTLITDNAYRELVDGLEEDYQAGLIFSANLVEGEVDPATGRPAPALADAVAAATVAFIEARMGRVFTPPASAGIATQQPAGGSLEDDLLKYN